MENCGTKKVDCSLNMEQLFRGFIDILPFSVVLCNKDGEVLFFNHNFLHTLPFSYRSMLQEPSQEVFVLKDIVCSDLASQIISIKEIEHGEMLNKCNISGVDYLPSIYFLQDREYYVMIMRNICDKNILSEEFIERLEAIISDNYTMIQSISVIMGETSVKRVKLLNSMIRSLR